MHLSGNIKRIRGLLEITQKDFATMMQVTENMQKSYETGRAVPDINYMDRLIKRTGIDEEQLKNASLDTDYVKRMMDAVEQKNKNNTKEAGRTNPETTLVEMNEQLKAIMQKLEKIEISLQGVSLKTLETGQKPSIQDLPDEQPAAGKTTVADLRSDKKKDSDQKISK